MRITGFTLVELVISMLLLSVFISVGANLVGSSVDAYAKTSVNMIQLNTLNTLLDRLSRELRMVQYHNQQYQIHHMTNLSIVFTKTDNTLVSIEAKAPHLVMRYSMPNASGTLTTQLAHFSLKYFAQDGITQVSDSAQVRFVNLEFALMKDEIVNTFNTGINTRIALRHN